MDTAQMQDRCPNGKFMFVARLDGYKFLINERRVATLAEDPREHVYGVVWDLSPEDKKSLDSYEGVDSGFYEERSVVLETVDGEKVEAYIYLDQRRETGKPRPEYLERILRGAKEHGLPPDYIQELELWAQGRAG